MINKTYEIITYILKIILLAAICVSIPVLYCYGTESSDMESKVKAAFIFNFAKFVEWPDDDYKKTSSQLFVIGVFGSDPIVEELLSIEGKSIKGKKLVVRNLSDIEYISNCKVVYIGSSERNNINGILNAVKNKEILTISDMSNFVDKGGNIGFVKIKNKIRFDINLKTAEKSRLKIRSDLLALARRIID